MIESINSPRSLAVVIDRILSQIPSEFEDYERLTEHLEDIKASYLYAAPEDYSMWWFETSLVLKDALGIPNTDWKKKVATIFANKESLSITPPTRGGACSI